MKKVWMMMVVVGLLVGCQSADPASRSNRAEYGDIYARITGTNNVVTVRVGDGLYASADGGGDSTTSEPRFEIAPEAAVALPGGSAGTGGAQPASGIVGKALEKLMAFVGGDASVKLSTAEAQAVQAVCEGCME